jgi:hypothetical protein
MNVVNTDERETKHDQDLSQSSLAMQCPEKLITPGWHYVFSTNYTKARE